MTTVSGEEIWLDGAFLPWSQAQVHILTHSLHYGVGVFEGIRCYRTHDERSAVFRLGDHLRRLYDSAHINLLEVPFPREEIEAVCLEALRRNHLAEGYLRPIIFLGDGEMGTTAIEERAKAGGRKSIVAKRDIEPSEILKKNMVTFKRPGTGISPDAIEQIIGKKVISKIKEDFQIENFFWDANQIETNVI